MAESEAHLWERIGLELQAERDRVLQSITSYPTPIAGCDQQFNHLLDQQAAMNAEWTRFELAREAGQVNPDSRSTVAGFLADCAVLDDASKQRILGLSGRVVAVSASPVHSLRKEPAEGVRMIAGFGVEGDAHAGATVRHRSRVARDPSQPNLRQVHLLHAELLDELVRAGFPVGPGVMGENVTTRGLDLLSLPRGTRLRLGEQTVLEVTGLRNPCAQLEGIAEGLMAAVLDRDENGGVVRRAGVMAVVVEGGDVRPGDVICAELPSEHRPLEPV